MFDWVTGVISSLGYVGITPDVSRESVPTHPFGVAQRFVIVLSCLICHRLAFGGAMTSSFNKRRRRVTARIVIIGVAPLLLTHVTTASQATVPITCRIAGPLVPLPDLPEASGVAASLRRQGLLWSHNDSGEPLVVAIDATGSVRELVRPTGIAVEDWEDLAVGPCPQGSCLYVADIGDNDAKRNRITVYRIPEPQAGVSDVAAEAFHATYPGGPRDAEALFVDGAGQIFIVTKGDKGPLALYRFPSPLRVGATAPLQQIGSGRAVKEEDQITGATMSTDSRWVVLRTSRSLQFYRAQEFLKGTWREAARVDVSPLKEPQGEGIALGANNEVYIVGEGNKESTPGTLGRLSCIFQR